MLADTNPHSDGSDQRNRGELRVGNEQNAARDTHSIGEQQSLNNQTPTQVLILHRRDPRRGRVVAAANATARQKGIVPQMPLSQADALCPDADVLEHDPNADIETLLELAESAQRFSPIVGIEPIDAELWSGRSLHQPQALFLNVTGIAPLFGGELALAQMVSQWMIDQGYLASIAIANSVGAAWALANYSKRNQIASHLLAVETGTAKLDACRFISVVEPDQTPGETFYHLSIDALRLEIATVTKLRRLGIRTIGQLVELPRAGLATRFGHRLLQRIDQTLAGVQETIPTLHASPDLACEHALEHPTSDTETIREVLSDCIRQLTRSLERMGHGALRIVCRLDMERNSIAVDMDMSDRRVASTVIQLGLFQPSHSVEHITWLLRGQLDNMTDSQSPDLLVRVVSVQATLTAPVTWQQNSLFDAHTNKHRDEIARLIDGLSSRLGRNAVVAPSLTRDPQPELAYAWRPLTGLRRDGQLQETKRKLSKTPKRDYSSERSGAPECSDFLRRPSHLIQPPRKLEVFFAPKLSDGDSSAGNKLDKIRYGGQTVPVLEVAGPERIESGWWHGKTQRRDYYRVILDNGAWLWIFHDRCDNGWYLHGEFD